MWSFLRSCKQGLRYQPSPFGRIWYLKLEKQNRGLLALGSLLIIFSVFTLVFGIFVFKENGEGDGTAKPTFVEDIEEISAESIFSKKQNNLDLLPASDVRVMIATGDVLLARTVNLKTVRMDNFKWAFEETADLLKEADVTFINLETPLIENCPPADSGFKFCGDIRNVEGLMFSGVDVVNLGNNHAGNWGVAGIEETVEVLERAGIWPVGVLNKIAHIEVDGMMFAFLGFDDIAREIGVNPANEGEIVNRIKEARKSAEIVVVQFSWGVEYQNRPSERQRELGKLAIDSGADLVIGNHPHWIQPIEIYKNKLITYSHGNFIFDQMWSQKTREGVVGKYTFYKNQLADVQFIPIEIVDFGRAQIIEDETKKNEILAGMREGSI